MLIKTTGKWCAPYGEKLFCHYCCSARHGMRTFSEGVPPRIMAAAPAGVLCALRVSRKKENASARKMAKRACRRETGSVTPGLWARQVGKSGYAAVAGRRNKRHGSRGIRRSSRREWGGFSRTRKVRQGRQEALAYSMQNTRACPAKHKEECLNRIVRRAFSACPAWDWRSEADGGGVSCLPPSFPRLPAAHCSEKE